MKHNELYLYGGTFEIYVWVYAVAAAGVTQTIFFQRKSCEI